MRVKLFATLRERAGASEIHIQGNPATVAELRKRIAEQHPALAPLVAHSVFAVNRAFAFDADPVHETDEVALFPPVSGGADEWPTVLGIVADPIDLNALQRQVTTPFDGAVVLFTGTVRGKTGDQETIQLEYEAYTEMALPKLRQIVDEIRARFPLVHGVALVQRIGPMEVGEPTVAVVISAGHRGDGAFEAARYGIDRLKQIVPVWKKEVRPDGSAWVEGEYVPVPGD
ncbi:MAG: molybdenum cofactor biosynthesis protein MoaE [Anaerolineae bacterium]|nr:molybdenum cofactor biosynthesis protein MoaE [Anaerolineae bacterium]